MMAIAAAAAGFVKSDLDYDDEEKLEGTTTTAAARGLQAQRSRELGT